jgi:hypothetical protein
MSCANPYELMLVDHALSEREAKTSRNVKLSRTCEIAPQDHIVDALWYSGVASTGFKLFSEEQLENYPFLPGRFVIMEIRSEVGLFISLLYLSYLLFYTFLLLQIVITLIPSLDDLMESSCCRVGFALQCAGPVLGDDAWSWAWDVLDGLAVHETRRTDFLAPTEADVSQRVTDGETVGLIFDLMSGDVICTRRKKRIDCVLVNLRDWVNEQKRASEKGGGEATEMEFEFYPAMCGKNVTVTVQFADYDFEYDWKETIYFRDFSFQYAAYQQSLSEMSHQLPSTLQGMLQSMRFIH